MHMQCQLEWNATSSEHACGTKINHVIDTGYQPSTKEQITVCHECNDATTQHNQQSHQNCIRIHVNHYS